MMTIANEQTKLSRLAARRFFVKGAMASLAIPALWLMHRISKRAGTMPENADTAVTVPLSAGNGIRFYEQMIVITSTEGVAVFSSKCPHLGCRINRAEGTELVCPCHGSRFDMHGALLHGPAARGLQPLQFELDRVGAALRVTTKK